jgi:hypothetical protein
VSAIELRHAESGRDVAACFPVMVQLRPHLDSADELVARVARQRVAGYRLLAAAGSRRSRWRVIGSRKT